MAKAKNIFSHYPGEDLVYYIPFDDFLGSDTIATVSFTVPTGLVKEAEGKNSGAITLRIDGVDETFIANQVAYVQISGGTEDTTYTVPCTITTTTSGETVIRDIILVCERKP